MHLIIKFSLQIQTILQEITGLNLYLKMRMIKFGILQELTDISMLHISIMPILRLRYITLMVNILEILHSQQLEQGELVDIGQNQIYGYILHHLLIHLQLINMILMKTL